MPIVSQGEDVTPPGDEELRFKLPNPKPRKEHALILHELPRELRTGSVFFEPWVVTMESCDATLQRYGPQLLFLNS